ncbi:MAG: hypothetical protein Q4D36_10995 [Bacteroidales bacterium]|nr:hypothetical protein [Bacteroidales bacterium]
MFALSGIFPITLLILGILAAILNRSAHFSRGRFVEWQTFNGVSLATLLGMAGCTLAWLVCTHGEMLFSMQFTGNSLVNFSLMILCNMFAVYQEGILFKNVLQWIGGQARSFDMKYSFLAIGVPLAVMLIKMPFMSPLDRFPTEDIIGALCYNYGFWHFATGLSIAYAIIMLATQFIQFIVVLRDSWKRLAIVCLVYFPVMASIFILSMYAVAGIFILFILYFVLSIINDRKQE